MNKTVEKELGINKLRTGFLGYTVEAYRILGFSGKPRILEIGCGDGKSAIELAKISKGEIIGIDIDEVALSVFREKLDENNDKGKIQIIRTTLAHYNPSEKNLDIVWEEGVFHLLDLESSLKKSKELLKPGGFFVSC
ncbi:MAG: class I SAM-dependent methyltransferase, partial [Acidobacteria bacterium]|nr:class I SAM-dependent methyltransferase [Acidobacteriota bacterium]